ncbi:MAG TPA: DMT family transporter [Acidimicrobiales bacterium]
MAVALGLFAALAFAAGTVLQQRGTLRTPAGDARFLVQILHEPVWLAGGGLQALGWTFQAAALDRGSLVVVQSLTTLSLVFALPLGAWLTDQHIGRTEIVGALAVVAGIVVFLSAGTPSGGTSDPSATAWWTAIVVSAVLVVGTGVLATKQGGATRAALFGVAAGVSFGLQAGVTKVFVNQIGHGVAHLLATWSTYGLIASALAGFVLQQSALKTGVLAAAMGANNATTLLWSVVLGFLVFDETMAADAVRRAPAWLGLALAVLGVITLASRSSNVARVGNGRDSGRRP